MDFAAVCGIGGRSVTETELPEVLRKGGDDLAKVLERKPAKDEKMLNGFQMVIRKERLSDCDEAGAKAREDADCVVDSAAASVFSGFPNVTVRPQDGYFIRDLKRDVVVCPAGNLMHRKCVKSNGYTRYICKASCRRCEHLRRCYGGKKKWKEIDFSEGAVLVRCRNWNK